MVGRTDGDGGSVRDGTAADTEISQYVPVVLGIVTAGAYGFGFAGEAAVYHVVGRVGHCCDRGCDHGEELYEEGKNQEYETCTAHAFLAAHTFGIKAQLMYKTGVIGQVRE